MGKGSKGERERKKEVIEEISRSKVFVSKEGLRGCRESRGLGKKQESRYIIHTYKSSMMNVILCIIKMYPKFNLQKEMQMIKSHLKFLESERLEVQFISL